METAERDEQLVEEWLAAARNGSREALGELLEHYRQIMVRRLRVRMYRDLQTKVGASDVFQEACVQVHQDFADFQGQTEKEFRNWLWRIVVHNMYDWYRRYRRTGKRDLAREVASADHATDPVVRGQLVSRELPPAEQAIQNEEWERLQEVLHALTAWERKLLEMRFQDGLSYPEICQRVQAAAPVGKPLHATDNSVRMFVNRLCRTVRVRVESRRWPGKGRVEQGKQPESKP